MGMSVTTGVVYGFKMKLSPEWLEEVEGAGFTAYPLVYTREDVESNQEYIFGIHIAIMNDAAQAVQLSIDFNKLNEQYIEACKHLSFAVKGLPSVLMTSYYVL